MMIRICLYAATLMLLTGCASIDRTADRATFRAIAPEYRLYVANDDDLDEGQKARRMRTVDTWAARIGEEGRR